MSGSTAFFLLVGLPSCGLQFDSLSTVRSGDAHEKIVNAWKRDTASLEKLFFCKQLATLLLMGLRLPMGRFSLSLSMCV